MQFSESDLVITGLFAVGWLQLMWLTVVLLRKGIAPSTIRQVIYPLCGIWSLLWPAYENPLWISIGLALLPITALLAWQYSSQPFWRHLRMAWSEPIEGGKPPRMLPLASLLIAMAVAAWVFQRIPEFGLGLALSIFFAFPLADMLDRSGQIKLGFPLHPQQTLPGHLALIMAVGIMAGWGLHLYHGLDWRHILTATLLAGMAASLFRALTPQHWNLPIATIGMATVLWLL